MKTSDVQAGTFIDYEAALKAKQDEIDQLKHDLDNARLQIESDNRIIDAIQKEGAQRGHDLAVANRTLKKMSEYIRCPNLPSAYCDSIHGCFGKDSTGECSVENKISFFRQQAEEELLKNLRVTTSTKATIDEDK